MVRLRLVPQAPPARGGRTRQARVTRITGFSPGITPLVRIPKENLLAVAVSNRCDDRFGRAPPMTAGNGNVYGGICRNVRLALEAPVYIPFQGNWQHEGGAFITTPEASAERAVAEIRAWVRNNAEDIRTTIPRTAA